MLIQTPSRIHITLIDLNASLGRVDGSIGIALEKPGIRVKAEISEENSLGITTTDEELKKRAGETCEKILRKLQTRVRDKKIRKNIDIEIQESYPQHIGLGSGTQLSLALASAISKLNKMNLSVRELAVLTERGGTSGIGVAAFEKGGFILDAGHSTKEKKEFLPSSASKASPPPIIARHDFPDWKIILVIPQGKITHGKKEINIFKKYCPINIEEVRRLSHLILMKTLPSVLDKDLSSFGESINEIQKTGFKKIELSLQSKEVKNFLKLCQRCSHGAGLSSFGPAIYCIGGDQDEIISKVAEAGEKAKIISTKANNRGAIIKE